MQWKLWNDQTRFKIVPAGRRSGKTELAKRRLVDHLFRRTVLGLPRRYFAAAPTREQAKRIFWSDFKALIPPEWKAHVSESELFIRTTGGAELWVVGLDRPQRMEGTPWDGGVIDELADCRTGLWEANIRPALADRRGWCWLIGVPDMESPGQSEYQKLVDRALSGMDPEWACFTWPSSDILPPEEVASARSTMDPRMFEQEFEGKFLMTGGRAFPDFNQKLHTGEASYDPRLPICWCLDFNIDPMCSGVIQHRDGQIDVLDELCLPDTRTDAACTAFFELAAKNDWDLRELHLYGDATGAARDSTSGVSDWYIIQNRLRAAGITFHARVPGQNPTIKDSLNAVNAKLKNADGKTSLKIDAKCRRLIVDLQTARWPCPNDLRGEHCLAWLRYFVEREYPIKPTRAAATGRIGFSK